jgi:glucokinase
MILPFKLRTQSVSSGKALTLLAGDIGATKCNLATFKEENGELMLLRQAHFLSHAYNGMPELLREFLKDQKAPDAICLGVAGPVIEEVARLSNLHWEVNQQEIISDFGINSVYLINDLEATAYGLTVLTDTDIHTIQKGKNQIKGNAAVIAPGTGLGEAGIYWDGNTFFPFATEGGHCDFAPRDPIDIELYNHLHMNWDHVSYERVISGPGILNMYRFLRDIKKRSEPAWLGAKLREDFDPALISAHVTDSPICKETMDLFIKFLAYESANLVLKMKATGGLFIGGGIAPQIVPLLDSDLFRKSFRKCGRLQFMMEEVPVKIILNPKTALLGAAWYAGDTSTIHLHSSIYSN